MTAPTSCALAPGRLADLSARVASGETTPSDLVETYLARIDEVQPLAEPWRLVDAKGARRVAAERTAEAARGELRGPLHGIPFAVKDIIDVAGLPTRCNAKMLADAPPAAADAEIVAALKCAGAIVLGKAHTTEFAFRFPSPARNPHNLAHTPGGSSSGSAAAVASGTVPLALGTQTMASVNRPAAYCGIGAFKPSSRLLPTYGVALLSPMYDTVGFYGETVADAVAMFEAIAPPFVVPAASRPASLLVFDDPLIGDMVPAMAAALEAAVEACRAAGLTVERAAAPIALDTILELHSRTMHYEVGRLHAHRLAAGDGISDQFRQVIEEGLAVDEATYLADRAALGHARARFDAAMVARAVLWPAAPGPAPEGLSWTGDARYIAPWTALGGPMVTIPAGTDAAGLPLGNLLIGRPGDDVALCALARTVAAAAEVLP